MIKYNLFFVFKELKRMTIKSFHVISYFSIQVNSKLKVVMQSLRIVIV